MTGRCQRCEAILVPRDRYCPACGAQVAQLYSTAPTALIPPVAPNGLSPSHGRTGWPPAAIVMAVVAGVILFASLAAALSRDPAGKAGQPVAQATSAVTSDVASVASLMEQLDGSCTAVGQGLRS
jgi:hypothetical protein